MCSNFISPSDFPRGEFKTNPATTTSVDIKTLPCSRAVTLMSPEGKYSRKLVSQLCEPVLWAHGPYKLGKSMSRVSWDVLPPCAETPRPNCKSSAERREVWPPNDLASHLP